MLKLQELRIGNWISHKGKPVRVQLLSYTGDIDHQQIWANGTDIINTSIFKEDFSGIELSEDIIYKSGFEKSDHHHPFFLQITTHKHLKDKRVIYFEPDNFNSLSIAQKSDHNAAHKVILNPDIKYVHELQNIYFDLTGEFLQITL